MNVVTPKGRGFGELIFTRASDPRKEKGRKVSSSAKLSFVFGGYEVTRELLGFNLLLI